MRLTPKETLCRGQRVLKGKTGDHGRAGLGHAPTASGSEVPNAVGDRRRQAQPGRPGGCFPWQGGKDPGQGVGGPLHQSFIKFYLRIILKMLYYIYTNELSILII